MVPANTVVSSLSTSSANIYNEERTTVSQNANHSLGMTWTNTASYDWTMGEHSFNALLGMEAYRYEGTYIEAKMVC